MPDRPSEFPNTVCWNESSRPQVMNTIALDVRPSIFQATHYPSFLLQGGIKEGRRAVPGILISESDFLKNFVDDRLPHVFSVAVGDSGTGKSHLIRWMHNEIIREESNNWHCVLIPRSSSNLADVIGHIIKGFQGEIAERIQRGLGQLHSITLEGAQTRVLDQIAFVLDPKNRRDLPEHIEISEDMEVAIKLLPALLHDSAIRLELVKQEEGIITRLARHVYGEREMIEEDPPDLKWKPEDLEFDPVVCNRAGQDAQDLALMLMDDPEYRSIAADCLNMALEDTFSFLLGLRYGDLNNVMIEIRKELLSRGQELILLIEDMSVTTGVDAELVEALQVRTMDTGEELCKVRSIVGLTHEDFNLLRENIRGRIDQIAFFDVGFSDEYEGTTEAKIGKKQILDFASRYLNAARYSIEDLDHWHEKHKRADNLPSYCEKVECPNLSQCHGTFGEVNGRGLYPLSPEAIIRLYSNKSSPAQGADRSQSFNPRLMVSQVLNKFLEEGERFIKKNRFPSPNIPQEFNLREVGASLQYALKSKYYSQEANRLRVALELYASVPNDSKMHRGISDAFNLPLLDEKKVEPVLKESKNGKKDVSGEKDDLKKTRETERAKSHKAVSSGISEADEFDKWVNEESIKDNDLNKWRALVHSAVTAWIDWDTEGLAGIKKMFMKHKINFKGQRTRLSTGEVTLTIEPSPEAALALRGLSKQFEGSSEAEVQEWLLCISQCVEKWANEVRTQLVKLINSPGQQSPVSFAAQLMAFGALIRNELDEKMSESEVLYHAMTTPWIENPDAERSSAWKSLQKAYLKKAKPVRQKIVESLVCSKGASIRESSMIDPSPILPALRHIQTNGMPEALPPESESWGEFQEVYQLSREVENHLPQALAEEKKVCKNFTDKICVLIEFTNQKDLSETFKMINEAFIEANNEGLLSGKEALELSRYLQRLDFKNFIWCFEKANEAKKADSKRKMVSALAALDRGFMEQSLNLIQNAERVIDQSRLKAKDRIKELGGDGETPDGLKIEINDLLTCLKEDLETITTKENE